jgi:predicted  nucleic acid-binding Zn-ribbon protein
MPHQCVKCGKIYGNDDEDVVFNGCKVCGSKLFFYVKKNKIEKLKKNNVKLTDSDREAIENDVRDILGSQIKDSDNTVILDFETIWIKKPGSYEIDLINLLNHKPLIYKVGEGKYIVDLANSFKKRKDLEKVDL